MLSYSILVRVLKKIKKNPQHIISLFPELKRRIGKRFGFDTAVSTLETKDDILLSKVSFSASTVLERINRLR